MVIEMIFGYIIYIHTYAYAHRYLANASVAQILWKNFVYKKENFIKYENEKEIAAKKISLLCYCVCVSTSVRECVCVCGICYMVCFCV